MEAQGGPRTGPEIREGRGNDFLGGFGGKRPCPKASWVPYNPFPSYRIPRMVFGPNLQHNMAPFGVPTTGFWMVFRQATLVFSTPGAIFGTPIPDLDPSRAGDLCCPNGLEKHGFVEEMVPHGLHGILQEGNGLYGTQEAFGQGRFPPNPPRK